MTGTSDDRTLADCIGAVIEDAAMRGLCREGQAEMAMGELRRLRPDWSAGRRTAFVEELMHGD